MFKYVFQRQDSLVGIDCLNTGFLGCGITRVVRNSKDTPLDILVERLQKRRHIKFASFDCLNHLCFGARFSLRGIRRHEREQIEEHGEFNWDDVLAYVVSERDPMTLCGMSEVCIKHPHSNRPKRGPSVCA